MACTRDAIGAALIAVLLAPLGCAGGQDPGAQTTPGEDGGTTDDTGGDETAVDTGPPPAPEYPAGPYGKTVGQTAPNLCFKGYRDGVAGKEKGEWTDICLGDYYDPDGTRGIRAIRLGGAALW
ncbi:MAG: hypothetical protein JNL79_20825 [Myxococcales bacterium]|nr:hypothetical protein [Myxococcales bacterium]